MKKIDFHCCAHGTFTINGQQFAFEPVELHDVTLIKGDTLSVMATVLLDFTYPDDDALTKALKRIPWPKYT